ncbi:MAG: hypothetical protein JRI81_13525 [Deltaproteobacteria bacterium]|nr:hypothetical protein [Deltaproteobacteria bacterium]
MITAQQIGAIPVSTAQAPTVSLQAGTIPAVTPTQLDINSIMNMMIMLMVMVMMIKMMTKVTERV